MQHEYDVKFTKLFGLTEQNYEINCNRLFGLTIVFGPMAEPIYNQITNQNLPIDKDECQAFDRYGDAITLLRMHGYITPAAAKTAYRRLTNKILTRIQMSF